MTHIWQLQHRWLDDGWEPGWLCEGVTNGRYNPDTVPIPWDKHGVESQASIVDR